MPIKEYPLSDLAICKCSGDNVIEESREISHFLEDPHY